MTPARHGRTVWEAEGGRSWLGYGPTPTQPPVAGFSISPPRCTGALRGATRRTNEPGGHWKYVAFIEADRRQSRGDRGVVEV